MKLPTLGLPLANPRAAWIAAALVFAIDLLTMARDLTLYDSPELALVAHQLGLGHPIGQPLHTWIGFVFAHLPGIDPLMGLGAMSALFGALTILPACALAERMLPANASALLIAPVIALAALHPLGWEPASRVEVYTLASFLSLWAVARASSEDAKTWPVGLALGLAASAHAVIAAAHLLALLPRVLRDAKKAPRAFGLFAGAGLAGLLPYVHLFIASADPRRFAWGAPRDAESLWAYLSGADYAHNAGIDAARFVDHLGALASWSALEASLPIALLGLGAHLALGRRVAGLRWALPIAAALLIAFVARNVVFHVDVPDYRGYLLAPWMSAAAGVGALAAALFARGGRFRTYGALVAALPAAALLVSPAHLVESPRDTPSLGRALAEGALAEAPRDAILIVESDHWVAPLLYVQEVEGERADVVVLPHGLASSSWYWDHLYARHGSLAPFALRGPGGRDGRIRRFLDAHADRAVLTESIALAERAGRTPCAVGWLVSTGAGCEGSPSSATSSLARLAPRGGEALESAARVGLGRSEALLRLGRPREAYAALLAGLHAALPGRPPELALPERAPPLSPVFPAWSRDAAIADPARNVFVAGLLARAFGLAEAQALFALAERMGLPEATPP